MIVLPVWMILVPYAAGLPLAGRLSCTKKSPAAAFLCGTLLLLCLFELVGVPCMLLTVWFPFRYAFYIYLCLTLVLAGAGLVLFVRGLRGKGMLAGTALVPAPGAAFRLRERVRYALREERESLFFRALFLAAVLLQMVLAVRLASFDGDDAYYVVQTRIAQQTERMYSILPYTGGSTAVDARHALAQITMWEAFLARLSGIHSTILVHSVLPLFFIPFTYLVFALTGRVLFEKERKRQPVFLILIALFQIFGNVSIYTPETFFLTRTWQGKALMANTVLPLLFYLYALLFSAAKEEKPDASPYVLLALANLFAGMCTSIGALLAGGLTLLFSAALCLYRRSLRPLPYGALCCVPNLLYALLYLKL